MSHRHEHGGNIFAVARSLGLPPERIVDFSASINPLGMAPGVREALCGCVEKLLHYPDKGATELKEAIAAYHGVAVDEIAAANGSTELIHLVPRIVKGRRALIVAPAFAEYASALARAGWETEYLVLGPDDDFALPLPALEKRLADGYDLLFICNPANPSGALIPKRDIAEIIDLCAAAGTFLVLDEAFIDFCETESAKELIRKSGRAILLRSMTKFFAIPGLRLVYAIAAPEVVAAVAALQDPWSVNTAAQVAGIASLGDAAYCERTRAYVDAERERLAAGFRTVPHLRLFPSRANYLLAQLLNGMTAGELRTKLMAKGILIRDCGNFEGLDGTFFRVAVRLGEENDRLLDSLRGVVGR